MLSGLCSGSCLLCRCGQGCSPLSLRSAQCAMSVLLSHGLPGRQPQPKAVVAGSPKPSLPCHGVTESWLGTSKPCQCHGRLGTKTKKPLFLISQPSVCALRISEEQGCAAGTRALALLASLSVFTCGPGALDTGLCFAHCKAPLVAILPEMARLFSAAEPWLS